MTGGRVLVYLIRRDLRTSDNPILHHLATANHGFTYLLPVYVLPPHQIEVSGFLAEGESNPYPPAVSKVGKFPRCGPNRAKFLAESVWDLKKSLEALQNGLAIRVGSYADVLTSIVDAIKSTPHHIGAVWMTDDKSYEEIQDQNYVAKVCSNSGIPFCLWPDEKYFIDDRDTGLHKASDLPDIFTTYRKSQEPLRQRPRRSLARPAIDTLPPFPPPNWRPAQKDPFVAPVSYEEFESRLLKPVQDILPNPPPYPRDATSAHPFKGGELQGWKRVFELVKKGGMVHYHETRNGLLGLDYSTKLSGYLALGCITARQVHEELLKLEDGLDISYSHSKGFNKGENEGTKAVRFELLWRDYMRLCTMKFGSQLFRASGFKGETGQYEKKWKTANARKAVLGQDPPPDKIKVIIDRFLEGRTGMGLIDAAQRELYHTGYTSNRARQNVASFFAKHLGIDWRYGAEWYETMLIDYDVSSNWANWQYVAGVGNDPRGDARIFNPVKQAFDYDNNGSFVRTWVPEVQPLEKLENVFQLWTTDEEDLEKHGLTENVMVTDPIKKIDFMVDRKPRSPRRYRWKRARGGRRGGSSAPFGEHSDSATGTSTDGDTPKNGTPWPSESTTHNSSSGQNGGTGAHADGPHITGPWASRTRGSWRGKGRDASHTGRGAPAWSYSHSTPHHPAQSRYAAASAPPIQSAPLRPHARGSAPNQVHPAGSVPISAQYQPRPSYPTHGYPHSSSHRGPSG